jgi:acyl carrier protein
MRKISRPHASIAHPHLQPPPQQPCRADTQIKSQGYRIELGEIEAALGSLACLRESAVVVIASGGFEQWLICCAYVPIPDAAVTPAGLRAELARLIPGYMLSARWQAVRRASAQSQRQDRSHAPETAFPQRSALMHATAAIVRDLTTLFSEKLAIDVPSPDTDLIESALLDSRQRVQLLLHVEEHIGTRIPLEEEELDDLRSLARLARVIMARAAMAA